jgi:hypothetical protein
MSFPGGPRKWSVPDVDQILAAFDTLYLNAI